MEPYIETLKEKKQLAIKNLKEKKEQETRNKITLMDCWWTEIFQYIKNRIEDYLTNFDLIVDDTVKINIHYLGEFFANLVNLRINEIESKYKSFFFHSNVVYSEQDKNTLCLLRLERSIDAEQFALYIITKLQKEGFQCSKNDTYLLITIP
jgi:hypothetical protein